MTADDTTENSTIGRRYLAADRRRRQAVPHPAGARHGRPRLRRRDRRERRGGRGQGARAIRRPMRWSTCGSATATASTWSRRSARSREDARAIILTGYGNIATAVTAVKLGAVDYLSKPADADDIYRGADAHLRRARRAAGKPDVGRPRALGAHPARLRAVRPQRLGDRAPAQHAPPHAAAHPRQARAAVECSAADEHAMLRHSAQEKGSVPGCKFLQQELSQWC